MIKDIYTHTCISSGNLLVHAYAPMLQEYRQKHFALASFYLLIMLKVIM